MPRPKGFAPWAPAPNVQTILDQISMVLDEYRDHLPLTARQCFYRMVGAYGYEKTQLAYKRLCNYLVRARRAQIISFSAIRDDGTMWYPCYGFSDSGFVRVRAVSDTEEYLNELHQSGDAYRRDRMEFQEMRIEAWCEAGGMAPQLARVCDPFGIEVYSTGGFSSVTVTREIAERALASEKPTVFLHIGDYDPSGESLYNVMVEDARKFVLQLRRGRGNMAADISAIRVAITPEQIAEYGIPTAPAKPSDKRSVNWSGETAQAEAIPPDLLAEILETRIRSVINESLMNDVLEEEKEEREQLRERLDSMDWDE